MFGGPQETVPSSTLTTVAGFRWEVMMDQVYSGGLKTAVIRSEEVMPACP
jgi:hypothetical protein